MTVTERIAPVLVIVQPEPIHISITHNRTYIVITDYEYERIVPQ